MNDEFSRYFYGKLTTTVRRKAIADMFEQHGWTVTLTNTMWHEEFEVSSRFGTLLLTQDDPIVLMGEVFDLERALAAIDSVLKELEIAYTFESLEIQDDLVHEIWRQDIAAIKRLLAKGANPNLRGRSWNSAIACAGENDDTGEIVRLLVAAGGDVNIQDGHGQTPLHFAVDGAIDGAIQCNHESINWSVVDTLLSLGADPQIPDDQGSTVFDSVARYGDYAQQSFMSFMGKREAGGQTT